MASAPPPMATTTANWHWKNKNVSPWAKTWFERELVGVAASGSGDEAVAVERVTSVEGDAELGQRKSKLITIYDCRVELAWAGTASDGSEVKGTLTIPEVSHEVTLDGLSDYVYEWTLTTAASPAVSALYALAKSKLPAALEAKFAAFPGAMLDTHGRDLQVVGTPSASGASTPVPTGTAGAAAPTPGAFAQAAAKKALNTSTVKTSATFMAPADELYSLLTDPQRIPMWTRAPATGEPKAGAEYTLFGGGVKGKYVELEAPKRLVQTWTLSSPTWPAGHAATLTTSLEQKEDSTLVTFALVGVPKGMEDEIKRNLEGYYVHGFKSIGYVPHYPAPSPPRRRSPARRSAATKPAGPDYSKAAPAIAFAVLGLVAAFAVPLLYK